MKKRVGGVEQFEFDVLTEGSQMTLTIAISGWVSKKGNEGQSLFIYIYNVPVYRCLLGFNCDETIPKMKCHNTNCLK